MKLTQSDLDALPQRQRAAFINCLSGYKSANLIGTVGPEGQANLAIVSSVVHLGANPPLLAFISRPPSVDRHTLEYLTNSGYFTINHVHAGIAEAAHQTSARYGRDESEFSAVGLTAEYGALHPAPYVAQSMIKIGLALKDIKPIELNGTVMVIGEIVEVLLPDNALAEDGFVDLAEMDTVTIGGLDGYYRVEPLFRLSYAKPGLPPRRL
ncbi:flavin reductase family protein [Alcanivorax sp. 1008]|uniref:flavin reductase family protein n=1 Tax=Alcanivorax sp. 1008 TaxID=2816853 RepID=UPI001D6BDCFD|nr:flavin reductase family protein [Alcanivorax sp. 1008]MCC1496253.1 flavin reductase [Alcanivorax sp. 1008]